MLLLLIISLEIEGKNINIITWISLRSLFYNYGQSRLAEITCYIRQIQINLENTDVLVTVCDHYFYSVHVSFK